VAHRLFLPHYQVAFDAWLATKPFTNPNAPLGPQAMPTFKAPFVGVAHVLDTKADAYYAEGQKAAETGDHYIRATVILASVLFLVGISTQFPLRRGRYALISVGVVLLLFRRRTDRLAAQTAVTGSALMPTRRRRRKGPPGRPGRGGLRSARRPDLRAWSRLLR
jgi:hypothetical protein